MKNTVTLNNVKLHWKTVINLFGISIDYETE